MNNFLKLSEITESKFIRQLLIFSPFLMYYPMSELAHGLSTLPILTLVIGIFFFSKKIIDRKFELEEILIFFIILYIFFYLIFDLFFKLENNYFTLNQLIEFNTAPGFKFGNSESKNIINFQNIPIISILKILFPLFIFIAFFNKISINDISQKLILIILIFNYTFIFFDHLGYYGLISSDSYLAYFFRNPISYPNSNLYPEPSYQSINLIYLLFLNSFCKNSIFSKNILNIFIILPILYYTSTYGIFLLIIFLALSTLLKFKIFSLFSFKKISIIVLSLILILFLFSIFFFNNDNNLSRDFFHISKFFLDFDFVEFNRSDPSTTTRIDLFLITFLGVSLNPLGYGLDSFGFKWFEIASHFNLYEATLANSAIINYVSYPSEIFLKTKGFLVQQSYLQNLLFSFGIIPIFLIFNIIFKNISKINLLEFTHQRIIGIVIALTIGFIQIQNTNPIWILIFILSISVYKKK